ncbi:hypothetical protein OPQ81_009025 [Rhizoctonia solani]|nr:hypothetical protein OPQ81_009025 [Rhizoctonia solani]
MTHEAFHKTASAARWPLLERQARLALQRIMDDPSNFSLDIRRMAGSTILMAVYGYDVTSAEDRLFKAVETAVEGFSQALVVPNYLVNTFHWLERVPQWFPGTNWKAKANLWRHQLDRMLHVPFEWTRSRMSNGTFAPCLLAEWLTKYARQDSDVPIDEIEDRIRWASATMFADIQAVAQAEIDQAIGTRLPEMADWESLGYVRCILKEVLRWQLALPLGMPVHVGTAQKGYEITLTAIPHACIQDDTYRGYHIPKGAIV